MSKKKINAAVLVSGGGTNLQALIDAQKSGIIKSAKIKLVISNKPDAYALTRAKNAKIKTAVITKDEYKTAENAEKAMIKTLEENKIDLIVLAGFLSILSEKFTKKYSRRIINVHPSLIPSFCGKGYYGLKVHEEALKKGVKVTGATTHFVNEIPDGGEIIMQKAVKVYESDTPEKLQKRVMKQAEWKILPLSVEKVAKEILETEK
ncbi:MAG: phosphoribosylglycinamide formyltransferase [Clostridiales bacterium]|nr:phosphoribosylglycinamide formyltransferase [Clostridiales bacterium]